MTTKTLTAAALTGLLLTGTIAGTVSAQSAAEATGLTEAQAIEIALAEVPGEVIETELETEDGLQVFEIEVLDANGGEFEIVLNAATGEVIEIEAEDDDDDDDRGGKDCDDDDDDAHDRA